MISHERKFSERLKETILASEADIADFVKITNFDEKLRRINNEVIANKKRYVETERKLLYNSL